MRHFTPMIYVPTIIGALRRSPTCCCSGYRITRASHAETLQQLAAEAEAAGQPEPAA